MLAGVPYASISPAYSLVSQDYGKLRHIVGLLTPGLVFASGPAYAKAIAAVVPADTPVVLTEGAIAGRATRSFAELLATDADRGGRCRACQGRRRHDRQVPVHLGIDQAAQGRDQHPAHAVREPADDPPVLPGAGRGAAGAGRLAALEPHLRRQPQRRHRPLQRRHALHRRRQADPGADRRDPAQPARDRADDLLQRAQGLRGDRQRARGRPGAAQDALQPGAGCSSSPAPAWRSRSGTSSTRSPSRRSASASACSPASA